MQPNFQPNLSRASGSTSSVPGATQADGVFDAAGSPSRSQPLDAAQTRMPASIGAPSRKRSGDALAMPDAKAARPNPPTNLVELPDVVLHNIIDQLSGSDRFADRCDAAALVAASQRLAEIGEKNTKFRSMKIAEQACCFYLNSREQGRQSCLADLVPHLKNLTSQSRTRRISNALFIEKPWELLSAVGTLAPALASFSDQQLQECVNILVDTPTEFFGITDPQLRHVRFQALTTVVADLSAFNTEQRTRLLDTWLADAASVRAALQQPATMVDLRGATPAQIAKARVAFAVDKPIVRANRLLSLAALPPDDCDRHLKDWTKHEQVTSSTARLASPQMIGSTGAHGSDIARAVVMALQNNIPRGVIGLGALIARDDIHSADAIELLGAKDENGSPGICVAFREENDAAILAFGKAAVRNGLSGEAIEAMLSIKNDLTGLGIGNEYCTNCFIPLSGLLNAVGGSSKSFVNIITEGDGSLLEYSFTSTEYLDSYYLINDISDAAFSIGCSKEEMINLLTHKHSLTNSFMLKSMFEHRIYTFINPVANLIKFHDLPINKIGSLLAGVITNIIDTGPIHGNLIDGTFRDDICHTLGALNTFGKLLDLPKKFMISACRSTDGNRITLNQLSRIGTQNMATISFLELAVDHDFPYEETLLMFDPVLPCAIDRFGTFAIDNGVSSSLFVDVLLAKGQLDDQPAIVTATIDGTRPTIMGIYKLYVRNILSEDQVKSLLSACDRNSRTVADIVENIDDEEIQIMLSQMKATAGSLSYLTAIC